MHFIKKMKYTSSKRMIELICDLLYNVSLNADGDFTMDRLNGVYNSMLI